MNGHSVISKTTKTASSSRTITIDDMTLGEPKKHEIEVNKRRISTYGWINNDLVFPRIKGGPRCPDEITRISKQYADKIGVKGFSMHGTRHTHATLLIQAGLHFKVIQARLGHASFKETMDIYSHVTPVMEHNLMDIIENVFKKSVVKPLKTNVVKQKRAPCKNLTRCLFTVWCGWWDLNPHERLPTTPSR